MPVHLDATSLAHLAHHVHDAEASLKSLTLAPGCLCVGVPCWAGAVTA
jgi:hypothetical protein